MNQDERDAWWRRTREEDAARGFLRIGISLKTTVRLGARFGGFELVRTYMPAGKSERVVFRCLACGGEREYRMLEFEYMVDGVIRAPRHHYRCPADGWVPFE